MTPSPCPAKCQKHSDTRAQIVLRRRGSPRPAMIHRSAQMKSTVCIVQSEACDFLMLVNDSAAYLIELKGSDVAKAIRQIHSTLDILEQKLRPRTIHARIVPTRVPTPNLLATSELKLRKRLGGTYKVQARVLQETIE